MTFKTFATAAIFAATAFAATTGAASAGGYHYNHYSAPSYAPGHSHVILGPAGTEQDFNYYARKDCRWLKHRAIETGYRKHWRAYRRCLRG
jgi:hypothetical protein